MTGSTSLPANAIAVVGMAGRFPGAPDVQTYWRNLRDGVESLTAYSDEALRQAGVDEKALRSAQYVKAGMPLAGMEDFDAAFFGFSPRDAAIMDPQHRHFLETAWEALEHAGYDPERFEGAVGVFGGSGMNAYMPLNLFTNPDLMQSLGLFLVRHTGNDKDFLTTRVSYLFNLRGPSVNVQTACSTSLVAIHMAAQSLLNYECDMALAGGVTIELPHRQGYWYNEGEILSPDGHCRAFDAESKGTVFGSGAGVVVLRRLSDALEAGDTVYAVLRGSAINNDGSGKMNYFAPSVEGQAAVIAEALAVADVSADSIQYVEAHGTGTPLGDPIEISALTQAFRATTEHKGYCRIGSVKTNIGHLDTAAGVASFIKVVQALHHQQMPPSLNFSAPNPMIDFANSPFVVNNSLRAWETREQAPRRAGISSLGVGGTNAHVVLEEAPLAGSSTSARPWHLLTLSARTSTALDAAAVNLAAHLQADPDINLADVAYTLQVGRHEFTQRRVLVVRDVQDAVQALQQPDPKRTFSGQAASNESRLVFMFPGGGAQYPNMGRDLYEHEPLYRQTVDECLRLIQAELPFDLLALLYPPPEQMEAATAALEQPLAGLVALFITEYAAAHLLLSWEIQPSAMTGHSMGEYTAACLAGVMSLRDALSIVAVRGKLFESLPAGAMLSVPLPESQVLPHLLPGVSIAVINTPGSCVVSGAVGAIEQMETYFTEQGVHVQRVKIAVAAHSPQLEPILEAFRTHLQRIRFQTPTMPFISNLTGTWADPQAVTTPQYWVDHLRQTVRFADGLATLLHEANTVFVEVGPGNILGSFVRQHPAKAATHSILPSIRHPREKQDDQQFMLTAVGRLWVAGIRADWPRLYPNELRRRIALPTYPFERQRYWIEPGKLVNRSSESGTEQSLTRLANLDDWFSAPVWKSVPLKAALSLSPQRWMIFMDRLGVGTALAAQLEQAGHEVIRITEALQYTRLGERSYALNPRLREDYFDLVDDLASAEELPQGVVHLWALTAEKRIDSRVAFFEKCRDNTLYSLLFLTQALAKVPLPLPIQMQIVSNGMQQVADEPLLYPEKAILLGACRVIPREFPEIQCRSIDVALPKAGLFSRNPYAALVEQLVRECSSPASDAVVAYRQGMRYAQSYDAAPLGLGQDRLRPQGVYLITGGLGGIGLTLAACLAQAVQAKLVLVSRSGMPERDSWTQWIGTRSPRNKTVQLIQQIQDLEALGAEVMVASADVTNRRQMQRVLDEAVARFGALHGVIHAAGVIDDNLISLKTAGAVEHVLAPKVRATLLLDELLREQTLDFLVLCSSTSTLLGPVGQYDYVAANAFLDAFAQSKRSTTTYTVALKWGMWQDVGMAATAATQKSHKRETATLRPIVHPLLGERVTNTPQQIVYSTQLAVDDHWVLHEHRLQDGTALIPGTGYMEIARAALPSEPQQAVEIRDLVFMSPLQVADEQPREVQVTLNKNSKGYYFKVQSLNDSRAWQDHVSGKVTAIEECQPAPLDIAAIRARCAAPLVPADGSTPTHQSQYVRFGPRWQVIREVAFGQGEALAALELPQDFRADLDSYALHPALMDFATGYALPLIEGYASDPAFYVPFSYGRVRVFGALPQCIYSYARHKGMQNNAVVFDIWITDAQGQVQVIAEDFMMRRLMEAPRMEGTAKVTHTVTPEIDRNTLLGLGMTEGIRPAEGAEIFRRVLAGQGGAQIVASSLPLSGLHRLIAQSAAPKPESISFTRPVLTSEYVAPRDEVESTLAAMWQKTLGIDQIGMQDDFFELGGESLIAVRLLGQIKKAYGLDLPLTTFFQTPTIAQSAELLRGQIQVAATAPAESRRKRSMSLSSLVPIQSSGSRPPLFCVHGAGGNVMVFSTLTHYLGLEQPIYGLQAQGVDGKSKPLTRLEDMAALYIRDLKAAFPHGPYLLAGFSMGGEVAFEMAQQLRAQGDEVNLLVLFDTFNPERSVRATGLGTATVPVEAAPQQGKLTRISRKLFGHVRRLGALSFREQVDYVRRDVQMRLDRIVLHSAVGWQRLRGETLGYSLIEKQLSETNLNAIVNYVPRVYAGRITLFRASENLDWNPVDHPMGWGPLADEGVDEIIIEGTHRLLDEPFVAEVALHLRRVLDQAVHSR
jgi:acyl transferase domain-containing protein/thioesterase domain-containing protein/acyl carrier protein